MRHKICHTHPCFYDDSRRIHVLHKSTFFGFGSCIDPESIIVKEFAVGKTQKGTNIIISGEGFTSAEMYRGMVTKIKDGTLYIGFVYSPLKWLSPTKTANFHERFIVEKEFSKVYITNGKTNVELSY